MTSVLTKLSEASQVTLSGKVVKPNIRMTEVGIVVDAETRTVPAAGRVTVGLTISAV